MALTRKMLKAMGIEDEKIDEIIEAHGETVDALKKQRDEFKSEAEKLADVQKQLDEANSKIDQAGKDPYKVKYEAVKEEFASFKKDIEAKQTHASKSDAYRALLKQAGVSEKRIDSVLRVSDVDAIEIGDDGKVKGSDDILKSIKDEWSDFIPVEAGKAAEVDNPPANNGGESDDDMAKMRHALGLDAYDNKE